MQDNNNLENLRAFIQSAPFNVRKIEENLNLSRGTITNFLYKTYTSKSGEIQKTGLGIHEEAVFEYMKRFGYNDNICYEQIL